MFETQQLKIHWQQIQHPILKAHHSEFWVCQIEPPIPEIAGNKWLKLAPVLSKRKPSQGILSLGGAFSNHLAALAAAGYFYRFPTIGLVRTDQLDLNNPTLKRCIEYGMQLEPINRMQFRQRDTIEFNQYLANTYPTYIVVPEGGSNQDGASGAAMLPLADTPAGEADILTVATASGGTLAGIIQRYPHKQALGLAVVKDQALISKVKACLPTEENFSHWHVFESETPYGKVTPQLIEFCCALKPQLTIEPIYTGKALFKLFTLLAEGNIPKGKRIAFFHTGGLQGLAGLHYRKIITDQQFTLLKQI